MSSILKISGPIRVGKLAADPANPEDGFIYFNTTSGEFRQYAGGSFTKVIDQTALDNLVASDIAYERVDGSKKNIQATSDEVESALTDLDDALGDISALGTPVNYSTSSESEVAARLAGIDTALATAGSSEFADDVFRVKGSVDATKKVAIEVDGLTTSTTRTITMPDSNVDLGDIAANTSAASAAQSTADAAIPSAEKGAVNGVATLDANQLIPIAQIPPAALERLVVVADETARFALTTATVQNGDTVKQTDTNIMYFVKDDTNLNSSAGYEEYTAGTASAVAWSGVSGTPTTVAGYGITDVGAVAKAAAVADSISDGVTDVAPSQNAVFDALAGKLANVSEDASPSLGGDLEVGSNAIEAASNDVILAGQNSVKRAKQASKSSFIEEEYIHSIAMIGSQTNTVISSLTFAHASIEGLEIVYKVKEATSGDIRIGTIRVVTNGTSVSLNDLSTETAETGISFDAVVNGANINIRYSSGSNGATMRADVKKFLA